MKIAKDYHEGETEAMRYGTEAHLVAEEFIRDGKPVPDKFAYMKDPLEALSRRRGNKLTEIKMGLTAAWVVDYKTSKSAKYADKGQLELMAMATFKHFPEVKKVHAGLVFVVAKKFVKEKYTDDMQPALWDKWLANYNHMEIAYKEDVWNARPSGLCKRHCAVIECVYNGSN